MFKKLPNAIWSITGQFIEHNQMFTQSLSDQTKPGVPIIMCLCLCFTASTQALGSTTKQSENFIESLKPVQSCLATCNVLSVTVALHTVTVCVEFGWQKQHKKTNIHAGLDMHAPLLE